MVTSYIVECTKDKYNLEIAHLIKCQGIWRNTNMKNKTVNKKVLRAMSIGLAAMMTVQPILATPVFADDTEPVDDSNTTTYEEGTESAASEESSESTESAAPSVSEATTNTIEVVNEITGYTNAAVDAASNTSDSISYATDLNELSTAENGQPVFPNDITTGEANPVNKEEYIQTQDNEIKTAMESAVTADAPAKDAAGNATTELKEAAEALSNVKKVEETKDTEESKDSSIIENKEAATNAANNAEEAVKTGNENVDKAIEAINNATSIAAAAQSAEEGNKAIADAEQAVSQYGDELAAARDRFNEAAEKAKAAEKAYNTAAKEANDAIDLAEKKYQAELVAIENAINKVNSSAAALEDNTVNAAVERFNAFVTNELGDASLVWTKEELNKTPEDRKEIAEAKYTKVRNIAAAKRDAAEKARTEAEAAYNNAMADKKAADEAWAAITDEGLKAVAEAQYKCDMTKSCDWAENGALNTLFEKVVKYYYVENKLLAEGDKLVDGVNVKFEHCSNPDLNNYFVVTYQVKKPDDTVENVTKYLNFKAGDKNKTKNALIIFERSDEIVFNEGTDTQFTALKTDLSFNDHGEADYQTEDGKDYKIVNVDGEYFALEISNGVIADGNTTTDYSEEDGYTKNEVKDYHYEVIEENGKKSLAKVVTGDAVKLVIRDKDTMDKVGDTEVENYYDWNDANELLESIKNQPGYEAYEGKDGLRVTWRPCKETSKYESAIFDKEGKLIVKDSKLYDTREAAIAACVEWARQKENYKNIFPTSGDEDRVKSVDMKAVMVKTGEKTITETVDSGFKDSDAKKIFNSEKEAQDAIDSIGNELKGIDIDKSGLKVVSEADGYIAKQECKLTFTTKVDLSGVRVTVPTTLSDDLKAIFGNDKNASSKAISALNNLFTTDKDLETILGGYNIDSISVDVNKLKDDNTYVSGGTETREITDGAVYITYSKSINVISDEKESKAEAISDANAKYDKISEQRDSVIDPAIASWTKDKLSNYSGTANGWFRDHKVFTEGAAQGWNTGVKNTIFGDIEYQYWGKLDTSIKDKTASAVETKKTKEGDASTSVASYKYSYEGTYSYQQDINKYYYTAEWTSPMRMVIGKYDVRTSGTELSRTVYGAGNATVNINASNALYDRFAKDSSKTDGLFFTYGENEDEGYKAWLDNSVTLYKNVKDAENAVKEKLDFYEAKQGELNNAKALFNKANNLTKEQRTAMEKAYAYKTALDALDAQKTAANNAKDALEKANANLIALNKAFDSEYMTEVDVAEINEDGTVSVSKKKVSKLSLYEEEVKKAKEAYEKALKDLSNLLDRVIELEGAYNDAVIRLTPAPATGGEETSPAGGGTTALAPATTLATTLAGAPAFTLPLVGDAAPAAGVAGARIIRGAADSDSDSTATDTTAKIAPEKEVEEDALAITKDTIKTIKDNETPLSSLTEDSTQKMNWWWLLLIALFGATGEEIYRRNKKKKEEAALEAEINKK